ncbi:hypothetical protein [Clostridium sp. KNHs214]|uniref:hypothetical protein n=1 Tax=Clostridium sp. KNHs214 TaxID=1540257 RepID=UPI00054E988E|nr:hypothetical protein [Clostridium sp. KNHs214]
MLKKIFLICVVVIIMFLAAGCSSSKEAKLTKEFLQKYYTVSETDYEKYKEIILSGDKLDVQKSEKDIGLDYEKVKKIYQDENEKFKPYLSEEAYGDFMKMREAVGRIDKAYKGKYYIEVDKIQIDKKDKVEVNNEECIKFSYTMKYSKKYIDKNTVENLQVKGSILLEMLGEQWKISEYNKFAPV